MTNHGYYIRHRGEIRGPLASASLFSLASAGKLKPFHEIAETSDGPWDRADRLLPELWFPASQAASSQATPHGRGAGTPNLHDVFISHSSKDKPTADAICFTLESGGIRCWVAPRDIPPGANWGEAIIDGLADSRVLVLVLSQHANTSPQVMREVERAVSKGIPIIPLRIEDAPLSKSMEYFLSSAHWLDAFTPPLRKHLDTLLHRVRALVTASPANNAATMPASVAASTPRRRMLWPVLVGGLVVFALAGTSAVLTFRPRPDAGGPEPAARAASSGNAPSTPSPDTISQPAWLGISTIPLPASVAEHLGAGAGAVGIAAVHPGGPAAIAGIAPDDVLTSFDGEPIADMPAFKALNIATLPSGSQHRLTVLRAKKPVELSVTLASLPPENERPSAQSRIMFQERSVTGTGLVKQLVTEGDFLAWRGIEGDPNLVICDIATPGEAIKPLYARHVSAFAFMPGGKRIVLASPNGQMTLCDTRTGEVLRHFDTSSGTLFRGCQVSPRSDIVATVSKAKDGAVLEIWDVETGKQRNSFNLLALSSRQKLGGGHRVSAEIVQLGPFSPSGRYVSTSSTTIIVWDVASGQPVWWWEPETRLTSWQFSPSWNHCAVANDTGLIEIVAVETKRVEHKLRGHTVKHGFFDGAQGLAWHGENLLGSASNGDGTVRLWRLPEERQIWEYRIEESPNNTFVFGPEALAFESSRPQLWTGVNAVRALAVPPCDATSWTIDTPPSEHVDFASFRLPTATAERVSEVQSKVDVGLRVEFSAKKGFADGQRQEEYTFQDGSKVTLRFAAGALHPCAVVRSPTGTPLTGDLGLTVHPVGGKASIVDIEPDGPAAAGGLVPGAVIVGFAEGDAEPFIPFPDGDDGETLARQLRLLAGQPGMKIRLQVTRSDSDAANTNDSREVSLIRGAPPPGLAIRQNTFAVGLDKVIEFSDDSRLEIVSRGNRSEDCFIVIGGDGKRLAASLGMRCEWRDGGIIVMDLEPDGPASRAGIRLGDGVIAIAEGPKARFKPCNWTDEETSRHTWIRLAHGVTDSQARLRIRRPATDPTARPEIVTVTRRPPPRPQAERKAARIDWKNPLGMPFVVVKPGPFLMGPAGFVSQDDAPIHYVRISKPFLISAFEVTQSDYATIFPDHENAFSTMGKQRTAVFFSYQDRSLPSIDTDDLPVDSVTWHEAKAFCDELGKRDKVRYRLPTEAEWEYACRAGGTARWDQNVAFDAALQKTAICRITELPRMPAYVGSRTPNDLGLYDMFGNVAEWCADVYDKRYLHESPRVNPAGPADGLKRVVRGGAYDALFPALYQRASFVPDERVPGVGFRLVIPLDGDVGPNDSLRQLAVNAASPPLDLSVIPKPLPIASLPVRSADEEREALNALLEGIKMLDDNDAVAKRLRHELPTFQRNFLQSLGQLGRHAPSAARAIDLYNQSMLLAKQGKQERAIGLQMGCLQEDELLGWPANAEAWELATAMPEERRDADMAVLCALKACVASGWRHWCFLDTLAAALAAAGEHETAVRVAEATIEHVPEGDRLQFTQSLERYRQGKTYSPQDP